MFFGSGIWGLIFVKSRILVFHRVFSWSKILGLSIPRSIQLVLRSRGLAAYWRSSSERRSTFSASNRLTNIQIWPPHQQTPAILVHVLNTKIQHSKIQIEKQIQIWSFKWTLAQQYYCIYVLCQKSTWRSTWIPCGPLYLCQHQIIIELCFIRICDFGYFLSQTEGKGKIFSHSLMRQLRLVYVQYWN